MEMVRVERQIRAFRLGSEAPDERSPETDRGTDRFEILGGPPLQIDPEQTALAEIVQQARRQLDVAVLAVSVVEADTQLPVRRAG